MSFQSQGRNMGTPLYCDLVDYYCLCSPHIAVTMALDELMENIAERIDIAGLKQLIFYNNVIAIYLYSLGLAYDFVPVYAEVSGPDLKNFCKL